MTDRVDPFEQAARETRTAPAQRVAERKLKLIHSHAEAPMKLSEQDQKLADQTRQMRHYHKWKRDQIDALMDGPNGPGWRHLAGTLKGLTLDNATALVAYVRAQQWLIDASPRERQLAMGVIGGAIIKLRIVNGLSPIDDALPGEPATAYEQIREILK